MTKTIACPACDGAGWTGTHTCERCHGTGTVKRPETNGDRIRAMTDEELAVWLKRWCVAAEVCQMCPVMDCPHDKGMTWADWLRQIAKD